MSAHGTWDLSTEHLRIYGQRLVEAAGIVEQLRAGAQ